MFGLVASTHPPEVLGLLSDPLRWQIVGELGRSDRRVGELVSLIDKPQNVVSYHLAELRKTGVATARRSSADGRDVYYRVDLARCRQLLAESGRSLHPALSLVPDAQADVRISGRPKLLFLCTGNSARSQIAEALAVHRSNGHVYAVSAGSHPKPLHPNAVRVLAARGIDISNRSTKPLTRYAGRRFDRVITLCDKVREICPDFPGAALSHWSIPDPASSGPDDTATYPTFVQVADDIEDRVALLLTDLAAATTKGPTHA
jgi:protein-tyrosine-phosphatase